MRFVPDEGLLGAARLALRVALTGDQRRCATLSNPACFMSGVRIKSNWLLEPCCGIDENMRDLPAEGLLGAARLALRVALMGDQRRCATLSNPACFMSGVRIKSNWLLEPCCGIDENMRDLPAEGLLGAARLALRVA